MHEFTKGWTNIVIFNYIDNIMCFYYEILCATCFPVNECSSMMAKLILLFTLY